jgi:hypothetical protein
VSGSSRRCSSPAWSGGGGIFVAMSFAFEVSRAEVYRSPATIAPIFNRSGPASQRPLGWPMRSGWSVTSDTQIESRRLKLSSHGTRRPTGGRGTCGMSATQWRDRDRRGCPSRSSSLGSGASSHRPHLEVMGSRRCLPRLLEVVLASFLLATACAPSQPSSSASETRRAPAPAAAAKRFRIYGGSMLVATV